MFVQPDLQVYPGQTLHAQPAIDYMVDIEALGLDADAAIMSIGAVGFGPFTGAMYQTFYERLDWEKQADRKIDASTLKFWLKQDAACFAETRSGTTTLRTALEKLAEFIPEGANVWVNGSSYDFKILTHAYKQLGIPVPWKYSKEMCMRSVRRLLPDPQLTREGVYHNALDDAIYQAKYVIGAVRLAGGSHA